ncbi:hypothetical protein [Novosphingobium sp. AP12]|uniref:hypothetical protein n=1 Tax=Novosphingobium sp. AP12 TaxID=1144305 RepID=UPI000271D980|nr:hypothetical protein [Novosphingobium sp. AP12]EJL20421.1 hypothetical protein PMI02_05540 [Novosphingobium sp. AP12]
MNHTAALSLPTDNLTQTSTIEAGYTSPVITDSGMPTLELLIEPDGDLDSAFVAYDRNGNTWLTVSGWLFEFSPDLPAAAAP